MVDIKYPIASKANMYALTANIDEATFITFALSIAPDPLLSIISFHIVAETRTNIKIDRRIGKNVAVGMPFLIGAPALTAS